jgi:hypothetical protein
MAYRVSLSALAETDASAAFEPIREAALSTRRSGSQAYLTQLIIFHIREDEQLVRVLRVWHASRDAIIGTDLED